MLLALFAGALLAPTSNTDPNLVIVFNGEGCRLNAFDDNDAIVGRAPVYIRQSAGSFP